MVVLQDIEGLETLTNLQQLWLGRNRIDKICNLHALTNLRQLSLQANRLEAMTGLGALPALEELYLSQNGIRRMEGLEALTRLSVLDLASNRVEQVCAPPLDALQALSRCLADGSGICEQLLRLTEPWRACQTS